MKQHNTPLNEFPAKARSSPTPGSGSNRALGFRRAVRYLSAMTSVEQSILQTLNELDQKVKTMATASPKPNLLPLFARLDELTARLPKGADPDLLHYLHKKSYEKARLLLLGRDAENSEGLCGH